MNPTKSKGNEILKRVLGILIIPVLCFGIMELVCLGNGTTIFTGSTTFGLFCRGTVTTLLLSFGVSINMHTGRFDFSTGATMIFGGICGAILSKSTGLGPVGMVVFSVLFAALAGAITGILYVVLNLPPMIIGLGMTLILEGVTAIITNGCQRVTLIEGGYYEFSVNPVPLLIIALIALAIMVYVFHYTKFGYDYRSLQTGQKIAVNTGVNEKKNAVICYIIAGAMFGGAGALTMCVGNGYTPTYNFSTISLMFGCFLPLFFSGFVGKFCNKQIAITISCIAYEFIQIGYGQIRAVNAGLTTELQSVIDALILVLFLIYINNETQIIEFVMLKNHLKKNQVEQKN